MNERRNLEKKINFIFNDLKYLKDFVFKKNNKISEKEIFEELEKKDKEFKESK